MSSNTGLDLNFCISVLGFERLPLAIKFDDTGFNVFGNYLNSLLGRGRLLPDWKSTNE